MYLLLFINLILVQRFKFTFYFLYKEAKVKSKWNSQIYFWIYFFTLLLFADVQRCNSQKSQLTKRCFEGCRAGIRYILEMENCPLRELFNFQSSISVRWFSLKRESLVLKSRVCFFAIDRNASLFWIENMSNIWFLYKMWIYFC